MKNKFAIYTLGCKTNQLESFVMVKQLKEAGFEEVDFKECADFYIINTCSVTSLVDQESKYYIRKARRTNPEAKVVVTGCFAQVSKDEVSAMPEVDMVLGNSEKTEILKYLTNREQSVFVSNIFEEKKFRDISAHQEKTRASIKVQDGCNNFCSYCIIPFARGRSRSNSLDNILRNVRELSEEGYKEIVLTGIHLGQWGLDFEEKKSFLHLLQALEDTSVERYRIGSLEPPEISDEVIDFLSSSKKFAHHLHLSLQSGCDEILELMRRHYDVGFYSDIIHKLKKRMPDIFLGSDIIVGFPSETDEQFRETYENLSKLPMSDIHVFPYSLRKNTIASKIEPQVADDKKRDRADRLKALAHEKKREFLESMRGQTLRVLIERKRDKKTGYLKGISGNYINILVDDERDLCNTMQNVFVKNIFDSRVYGEIVR